MAYHGTKSKFVTSTLTQGLRSSTPTAEKVCCYLEYLGAAAALYLSPSIEYAAHPRYAEPIRWGAQWAQVVLQVRVNPRILCSKMSGTLPGALSNDPQLDSHFSNEELEWIESHSGNAPHRLSRSDRQLHYASVLRHAPL